MSANMRLALVVVAGVLVLVAVYALALHNYRECRAADFSRTYCTFTHLLR